VNYEVNYHLINFLGPYNFVVYSDTSKKGLRRVLMQNGKVVADASRQLKN
jgi:hypothetical protein